MTHRGLFGFARATLAEHSRCVKEQILIDLPDDTRQTVLASFVNPDQAEIADRAKRTGELAPDFRLPSARGGKKRLSELLQSGPVVLSFFRGGWCPFCQLELEALQRHLPEIRALGATLIGIAPETLDNTQGTMARFALGFELLSDRGNLIAHRYGLVMTVTEAIRPLYVQWGLDIPHVNGDESYRLPVPATYIVGSDGIIQAAHVEGDWTVRMEPQDIVHTLRQLQSR